MTTTADTGATRRVWGVRRVAALLLVSLTLAAGLSLFSVRAYAAFVPVPPSGGGGHLALQSDPYPAEFLDMSPGETRYWTIAASLLADPSASLDLQFSRSGALVTNPNGLIVRVQRCDSAWADVPAAPACASGATNVYGPARASTIAENTPVDLNGIAGTGKYLLVTMSIPGTAAAMADKSLQGISADIGFGLTAAASAASPPPATPPAPPAPAALAFTGADITSLLLIAAGLLGLGIIVSGVRRARRIDSQGAHV